MIQMDIQYLLYTCFWNGKQESYTSELWKNKKQSTRVCSLIVKQLTLKKLIVGFEGLFPKVSVEYKIFSFVSKTKKYFLSQKKGVPVVSASCSFHFAPANWSKKPDLGLKKVYGQQTKIRILTNFCVSLALIPPQVLIIGSD